MASTGLTPGQRVAKAQVEEIAEDRGYLLDEDYASMSPAAAQRVRRVVGKLHGELGRSAVALAKDLYTKDVRFVFELLQNADDNLYTEQGNAVPYVAFHLHQSKVIVECNEDGFTEEHLQAISRIGNSSKTHGHGYIGEKGIGFKSVFQVAGKAEILSGDYSFSFAHCPGDSGIGMITPRWVNPPGKPSACMTRITLHLLDDAKASTRRASIEAQLRDLEPAMLLFLKKLQRIEVHFYADRNGEQEKTEFITMSKRTHTGHMATLCKARQIVDGPLEEKETRCMVVAHQVTGLEKSDNREYTEQDEQDQSYSRSEVIVAFPVTNDMSPLVEAQQVFAFLPVCRPGFNFLIHADFVTVANREGVKGDSPRNLGLLSGIADTLLAAFRVMYDYETLRYQWMRYLQNIDTVSGDGFWRELVNKIRSQIQAAEILEPRRQGTLRLIQDLKRLPPGILDDHGEPLLGDLPGRSEKYLSRGYTDADLEILGSFGLTYMGAAQWVALVKHDLEQTNSRIKSRLSTDGWHTRVARALNDVFSQNGGRGYSPLIAALRELCLIPLANGNWVCPTWDGIYFPFTRRDSLIPNDLGLRLVHSDAYKNKARKKLYANLGATYANPDDVREQIFRIYTRTIFGAPKLTLKESFEHMRFLYQNHQPLGSNEYSVIKVFDTKGNFISPSAHDVYLTGKDPFSLWQLSGEGRSAWFTKNVAFLDEKYCSIPAPKDPDHLSLDEWLGLLGVRAHTRLVSRDSSSLSPVCLHVAEEMPSKFLGFLQYAWETEGKAVASKTDLVERLCQIPVLCKGRDEKRELGDTYMPLPSLMQKCSEFMRDEFFPFLDVGESWAQDEDGAAWAFLKDDLEIGSEDNMAFYADILSEKSLAVDFGQVKDASLVLGVYKRIYLRWAEMRDSETACISLRNMLGSWGSIYIPPNKDNKGAWVSVEDCMLDSPLDFQHHHPVIALYKDSFPSEDLTDIVQLFRDGLGMSMFTWHEILNEAAYMKEQPDHVDLGRLISLYQRLDRAQKEWADDEREENTKMLRDRFEEEHLILAVEDDNRFWAPPSSCIWSAAANIRYMASLSNSYKDDLEGFFVDVVGVSRLTADMVYDQLVGIEPATTTVEDTKQWLMSLSSLLGHGKLERPAKKLVQKPIFPVRYPSGAVRLVSSQTDFAIVDRQLLEQRFQGKAKFLDFSLSETHQLEPLLAWMGLSGRYLSQCVTEKSVVDQQRLMPLTDTSRHLRSKAHALTRIAVHFKSPHTQGPGDVQKFHDLLHGAAMWETGRISSVLTMEQDGSEISGVGEQHEVHIAHTGDSLTVYVPHDEVLQEVCFGSTLPGDLGRWMFTDLKTRETEYTSLGSVIRMVTAVLGARSSTAMNRILDKDGIVNIKIEPPTLASGQVYEVRVPDTVSTPILTGTTRSTMRPVTPSFLPNNANRLSPQPSQSRTTSSPRSIFSPKSTLGIESHSSHDSDASDDDDTHIAVESFDMSPLRHELAQIPLQPRQYYRTLLEHVVFWAVESTIPPQWSIDFTRPLQGQSPYRPELPPNEGAWLSQEWPNRPEAHRRMGAAGELYVFELLKSRLKDFTEACWQSTIRHYVTGPAGHPRYANMGSWRQKETSDIVYDDADGELVEMLVEKQYLNRQQWSSRRGVRCYIEVKSTFGNYDTPFFMSVKQYDLMRELTSDNSIYMIFRVFNLDSDPVGLKIYVNPYKMMEQKQLAFSATKWAVTPRYF